MTRYRKRMLLIEQMALTEAIMTCEGVAFRAGRGRFRDGARLCAEHLTKLRDYKSEESGLRKEMGWSK